MCGKHHTTPFSPPKRGWEASAGLCKCDEETVFTTDEVLVQTCLYAGNTLQRGFHRRGGAVKHVQASLSARKDGESSYLLCGSPVKLVQACLCMGSTVQRRFHRRGGAARKVQASSIARNDGESTSLHCGSPVKLEQACLCVGSTLQRRFHRPGSAVKLVRES